MPSPYWIATVGSYAVVVRVGVDVTPLLGDRTGVGQFVASLVDGLGNDPEVELMAYSVTARGWRRIATYENRGLIPGRDPRNEPTRRVKAKQRGPMPARPLRELWRRFDWPVVEWWTGPLDVVHGTNFVVPPSKRAVQLVSVHDMTTIRYPELCTPDTLQYPGLISRAVARGAHVHTDSAYVAAEVIAHFGIDPARVHTIHLGLPAQAQKTSDDCAIRSDVSLQPVRSKNTYILAIGTVEPRKDYPSLLVAFGMISASHPELRLVIVGQSGWGEDAYQTALAKLPNSVRERIDRRGFVVDEERDELLRGASVLVYPSVYEGFGLPPLEAMQAGVPVVSTTAGSLPEILGQAASFVSVGAPDELAQAIERVLSDSTYAADLRRRGFAQAALYQTSTMIEKFVSLYTQLDLQSEARPQAKDLIRRKSKGELARESGCDPERESGRESGRARRLLSNG